MTKFIPRDKLEHLIWTPQDSLPTPQKKPSPAQSSQPTVALEGSYLLMDQADTYAKGVHNLQKACQKRSDSPHPTFTKPDGSLIYRPLTFKETLQIKIIDYNTLKDEEGNDRDLEDRLRFFNHWIDSCTGMAYKGGTTKFKVVPTCEELITIKNSFNETFLPIEYDAIVGVELDTTAGKYDTSLTKKEVMDHPGWLAAVDEDKELLRKSVCNKTIWFL